MHLKSLTLLSVLICVIFINPVEAFGYGASQAKPNATQQKIKKEKHRPMQDVSKHIPNGAAVKETGQIEALKQVTVPRENKQAHHHKKPELKRVQNHNSNATGKNVEKWMKEKLVQQDKKSQGKQATESKSPNVNPLEEKTVNVQSPRNKIEALPMEIRGNSEQKVFREKIDSRIVKSLSVNAYQQNDSSKPINKRDLKNLSGVETSLPKPMSTAVTQPKRIWAAITPEAPGRNGSGCAFIQLSVSLFLKPVILSNFSPNQLTVQKKFVPRNELLRSQWVHAPPLQPPKSAAVFFN